jgi:hypothetical protein
MLDNSDRVSGMEMVKVKDKLITMGSGSMIG